MIQIYQQELPIDNWYSQVYISELRKLQMGKQKDYFVSKFWNKWSHRKELIAEIAKIDVENERRTCKY